MERSEERFQMTAANGIRFVGVLILLAGLYSAWLVAERAWGLLDKPERIIPFATEIEKQTNFNAFVGQITFLVDFISQARGALPVQPGQSPAVSTAQAPIPPFNGSYFSAWIIVILLLGIIGKISFWAISAGGQLAVSKNDRDDLKLILREILRESRVSGK